MYRAHSLGCCLLRLTQNGDGADEEPEFSLISGGLLSRPRDQEEVYTGQWQVRNLGVGVGCGVGMHIQTKCVMTIRRAP